MKVLFIGGTGNISSAVASFAIRRGIDLTLLNRGTTAISGARSIIGDMTRPDEVASALGAQSWDAVVNWIAFTPADIRRDFELFQGRTKQYVFISSASAYQRPAASPFVTESTPLVNPFWQYSRDKIACEMLMQELYRERHFPITIVRPSLTYNTVIPLPMGGWREYTIVDRIKKGKKVIVHGDGSSLWTITHADDFAVGFVGLLGHQQAIGHAFHITSDEVLTWDQIFQAVGDAVHRSPDIVHIPSEFIAKFDEHLYGSLIGDKATSVVFDNSKIKRFVPEFHAIIPFSAGIRRTIEWFEADPKRMVVNPGSNALIETIIAHYEKGFPASSPTGRP